MLISDFWHNLWNIAKLYYKQFKTKIILRIYTVIIALLLGSFGVFSHGKKAILSKGYYEARTLEMEKGKPQEGYIYLNYTQPRFFQGRVRFGEKKTYEKYIGKKLKNKFVTDYSLLKVVGFKLKNGQVFKKVKYVNILATKTTDMLPKSIMVEQVAFGKINLYKKHYKTTNGSIYNAVIATK